MIHLIEFLIKTTPQQRMKILKTLKKEELKLIIEIIFNVVYGVCPIFETSTKLLLRYKGLIRQVIADGLRANQRRSILIKFRKIIPVFVQAYVKYVS
jgi:hypothetical protein